jgi:glucose/arabinose dehydrogenase
VKKFLKWLLVVIALLLVIAAGLYIYAKWVIGINVAQRSGDLDAAVLESRIKLPDGFSLSIFAADIPNARMLLLSRGGHLLVANPGLGKITLLERDIDRDGQADGRRLLIDGLNGPNGMDFHGSWLYIAETDAIARVPFDHETGQVSGRIERIVTGLPAGGNHWQKTLRFGPDGLMYLTIGSSCNVCLEDDPRRGAMLRYQPDGSGEEFFATGLRNSAGFDWAANGDLFATDNGRDMLGDDFPPCELNLVRASGHYGWPFVNGNNIVDPDFGETVDNADDGKYVPPAHEFRAHNAPLGIQFLRGKGLPAGYDGAALVALHGSWNRSEKDGYKIVSLHWDSSGGVTERDFVTGFLQDDDVVGRPVEIEQGQDGAIYVSDDFANVVYRISYGDTSDIASLPARVSVEYDKKISLAGYEPLRLMGLRDQGGELFDKHECAGCHLATSPVTQKLEGIAKKYNVQTLVQFLSEQRPPMPVYPLTEDDREALAVYLIDQY